MHRRSPALLAAVALAALLAPSSVLAARVRVRVEGRTQTIFAPAPRAVTAATALEALDRASIAGEFYWHLKTASFGSYVDQIGRWPAAGSAGWAFKVNGVSPPVGADAVQLQDGDSVLWYWAEFGPAGGPPTLSLKRVRSKRPRTSCYRVSARDDAGKPVGVSGVALHVDGRVLAVLGATRCLTGRHGAVRATAPGTVRSNAVR